MDTELSLAEVAEMARTLDADITVIPDGDRYLWESIIHGWRGKGRLNLLAMRPSAQPNGNWVREAAITGVKRLRLLAANCRAGVAAYALRSPLGRTPGLGKWVHDPVTLTATIDDVNRVRSELLDVADGHWVAVVGSITERKNLELVGRSLLGVTGANLLLAGKIEPSALAKAHAALSDLRDAGVSVIQWNRPLTDREFDAVIGAVDCIVAAHTNEGPSGVVSKAAAAGTRLVLAGAHSLRRDAKILGRTRAYWCRLDTAELRAALVKSLAAPAPLPLAGFGSSRFTAALLKGDS
ncbi:hypothetical protein [Microbacterium sp. NPDC056736]|uniref:hypothetical protein n=1 Tax=Microbacterium sp. NPDC056736 TaxID=3345932 RepID=UPI0036714F9D